MTTQASTNMFNGVHAVLYAMFDEHGEIDVAAMQHQVEYCLQHACDGIVILGLATEVWKLSMAERQLVISKLAKSLAKRAPLGVTIAGDTLEEQWALIAYAEQQGADWVILQPPMIDEYEAEDYLQFFSQVAQSTKLPVCIQNAPQFLGRSLSAEDLRRLQQQCPNVIAIKSEEAVLGVRALYDAMPQSVTLMAGRGGLEMIDMLEAGCQGFVLAPDIAPVAKQIDLAWQANQQDEALALYAKALPAMVFAMQSLDHLMAYGKRIFAWQVGCDVNDRQPATLVTEFGLERAKFWAKHLQAMMNSRPLKKAG